MRKNLPILALFVFNLCLVVTSCSQSLSPFTQRLYERSAWTEADLKRVQFYLSNDVVLWREAEKSQSTIEGGEIRIKGGRKIEEITIRRGTPGTLISLPKEDRFAVSFESGSNARFLIFGPSPKRDGMFVLLAKDWKNGVGNVTYDNKTFKVTEASSLAALLVDLRRTSTTKVRTRTAEGRTVD